MEQFNIATYPRSKDRSLVFNFDSVITKKFRLEYQLTLSLLKEKLRLLAKLGLPVGNFSRESISLQAKAISNNWDLDLDLMVIVAALFPHHLQYMAENEYNENLVSASPELVMIRNCSFILMQIKMFLNESYNLSVTKNNELSEVLEKSKIHFLNESDYMKFNIDDYILTGLVNYLKGYIGQTLLRKAFIDHIGASYLDTQNQIFLTLIASLDLDEDFIRKLIDKLKDF